MKRLTVVSALAAAFATAACTSEADPGSATDSSSGMSSTGSGGGGAGANCKGASAAATAVGVPVSNTRECVDASQSQTLAVCQGAEDLNAPQFQCLRRIADGVEFWLNSRFVVEPGSADWEKCDPQASASEYARVPPPCFTECGDQPADGPPIAPRSTCGLAETKKRFLCGDPDSSWDDNCCRRRNCGTTADCASNEECRMINPPTAFIEAWAQDVNECSAGGSAGGAPESFCFPK